MHQIPKMGVRGVVKRDTPDNVSILREGGSEMEPPDPSKQRANFKLKQKPPRLWAGSVAGIALCLGGWFAVEKGLVTGFCGLVVEA